jgi:hypothetical protein
MSTDEELMCPGATGPSSIGYVAGFTECQAYPGCYRGTLALPGRADVRPWHCCHTHAGAGEAAACARAVAAEMGWALLDPDPCQGRGQPEVRWAPYREFGIGDPAEQAYEPPAGPVIICATGYQMFQGTERIVIYWSRDGRRSTSAGHQAGMAG